MKDINTELAFKHFFVAYSLERKYDVRDVQFTGQQSFVTRKVLASSKFPTYPHFIIVFISIPSDLVFVLQLLPTKLKINRFCSTFAFREFVYLKSAVVCSVFRVK